MYLLLLYVCSWNISFMLCNYILQNLIKSFQKYNFITDPDTNLDSLIICNLQPTNVLHTKLESKSKSLFTCFASGNFSLTTFSTSLVWWNPSSRSSAKFSFEKKMFRNLIFNTCNNHFLSSTIYRRMDLKNSYSNYFFPLKQS